MDKAADASRIDGYINGSMDRAVPTARFPASRADPSVSAPALAKVHVGNILLSPCLGCLSPSITTDLVCHSVFELET